MGSEGGQMGSYGMLARRALETEMPVMVQVIMIVIAYLFFLLFQLNCSWLPMIVLDDV